MILSQGLKLDQGLTNLVHVLDFSLPIPKSIYNTTVGRELVATRIFFTFGTFITRYEKPTYNTSVRRELVTTPH